MNFEDRKRKAQEILVEFLSIFSPPRGLDDSQMAARIAQISDAFARRMPEKGDFEKAVHAVLIKVMDTHFSNTWPAQAAFVLAMPQRELSQFRSAETYRPSNPVERMEGLMDAGEAIPETAVWGVMASQLPRRHLDRYRNASVLAWMDVYGPDAAQKMRAIYGASVDPYFPQAQNLTGGA